MKHYITPVLLASLMIAAPALAGEKPKAAEKPAAAHSGHAGKKAAATKPATAPTQHAVKSSTQSYRKAAAKMHKAMDIAYTGDANIDFARGMVPHHQGAVDMAETVLKYGKDPEIKKLAEAIIRAQKSEIGVMNRWLWAKGSHAVVDANSKSTPQYKAAMESMHHGMMIKYTGNADRDFANGMIPHHEAAIAMAETLIHEGTDPELLDIARDVVRSQGQEIALMKEWLEKH